MQPPALQDVTEDGTVIERDGTTHESPGSMDDIEFMAPEEWATPYERAVETIEETVDDLCEQVPASTLAQACRDVGDRVRDIPAPTERKAQTDQLKSALAGADGVGWRLNNRIVREFETVTDLCDDLRSGGDRLRSLRGIGEETEQAVIDALVESGEWFLTRRRPMQPSNIAWCEQTWNPVHGCSKVEPHDGTSGCTNCYAARISQQYGHTEHPWTTEHALVKVLVSDDRQKG